MSAFLLGPECFNFLFVNVQLRLLFARLDSESNGLIPVEILAAAFHLQSETESLDVQDCLNKFEQSLEKSGESAGRLSYKELEEFATKHASALSWTSEVS